MGSSDWKCDDRGWRNVVDTIWLVLADSTVHRLFLCMEDRAGIVGVWAFIPWKMVLFSAWHGFHLQFWGMDMWRGYDCGDIGITSLFPSNLFSSGWWGMSLAHVRTQFCFWYPHRRWGTYPSRSRFPPHQARIQAINSFPNRRLRIASVRMISPPQISLPSKPELLTILLLTWKHLISWTESRRL